MSTTIKSCLDPEYSLEVAGRGFDGSLAVYMRNPKIGEASLAINPADLIAALRAEGVLTTDDGLRERIEALIKDRDARGFAKSATEEIREALNPTPPFEFPSGLGAVVEVTHKDGSTTSLFTRSRRSMGSSWTRENSGHPWSEDEIRERFPSLRTLSEGLGLK